MTRPPTWGGAQCARYHSGRLPNVWVDAIALAGYYSSQRRHLPLTWSLCCFSPCCHGLSILRAGTTLLPWPGPQERLSGSTSKSSGGWAGAGINALGLHDEEAFLKIPCINDIELAETVRPFSLVRYRGLVQDVFEPEIYIARMEECDAPTGMSDQCPEAQGPGKPVTTKYRECVEAAPGKILQNVGQRGISQRGVCYCVPLPGETAWARAAVPRPGEDLKVPVAPSAQAKSAPKRARDDVDLELSGEVVRERRGPPATRRSGAATKAGLSCGDCVGSADEFGLNFPLPWEECRGRGMSTACIVKTYDADAESLRVCDTVELLGILCLNPDMANLELPVSEVLGSDAREPSTSLVPRLHVIAMRKLPFYHPLLPFTPSWLSEARLAAVFQRIFPEVNSLAAARRAAIDQLLPHLGGDMLAAEYMLMMLVSRSFGKHGDKSLGCWSLNLAQWPQGMDVRALSEAAGDLVPRAVYLELSNQTLSTQKWRPCKDFVANRLVAAQLQLAPGTLLILDETHMSEGQLPPSAVKAIQAVNALATEQQLVCDFTAYDVNLPLELSVILVSRGRSIIKGADAIVPLSPKLASCCGPLEAARWLVALVTRDPKALRIPDAVAERVSEDFANVRAEFSVPQELCSTWMNLARAHCLTYGDNELTADRWHAVAELERERLRRCHAAGFFSANERN